MSRELLVDSGELGWNRPKHTTRPSRPKNPTYHAEFLAIERALEALETDRLTDCTLYVTIEPCAQCAGAIVLAKVGKLVFGA